MGFFDWIGDAVGKVWSGIKDTASSVYSGVKKGVDWVAGNIQPIVKTVGDIASYIPVIGAPISGIANQIGKGIDVVRGAVGKVGEVGKGIGLLKQNKYSRAMM
jgi:phage-related protein